MRVSEVIAHQSSTTVKEDATFSQPFAFVGVKTDFLRIFICILKLDVFYLAKITGVIAPSSGNLEKKKKIRHRVILNTFSIRKKTKINTFKAEVQSILCVHQRAHLQFHRELCSVYSF